jgi:hypothetical protein
MSAVTIRSGDNQDEERILLVLRELLSIQARIGPAQGYQPRSVRLVATRSLGA